MMDTPQLAELLHTNEQIVRAFGPEGISRHTANLAVVKFTFLRHEIFDWLIENRYEPDWHDPYG